MQYNIISYTLFLFEIAMFIPPLINAPWTEADPPKTPPDDMENDCAHWIEFNGFSLTDYRFNRNKAMSRDFTNDRKASKWSAIYAFKIGGREDIYQISPQEFCNSFGDENKIPKRFKALEDEYLKCNEWIQLYRFNENHSENFTYARNVDPSKVKYISIWAFVYWSFLYQNGPSYNLSALELCNKMGIGDVLSYTFWCDHGKLMTCMDWLELYELRSDHPEYVLHKASNLTAALKIYPIRVQYFAKKYASELVWKFDHAQQIFLFKSKVFCKEFNGNGDKPKTYEFQYEGP